MAIDQKSPSPSILAIELQQLSHEYWARVDGTASGSGAELFASDGSIALGPVGATGRDQIAAMLAERSAAGARAGRSTRHVTSNYRLVSFDDRSAVHRFVLQVYAAVGPLPQPPAPPSAVVDFEEKFIRDETGEWRLLSSTGLLPFMGSGAPAFAKTPD